MNFLTFEYFLALCQADTIRQAAERLYISPQALSEYLGKLERELETPLFLRTLPLKRTPAGDCFAQCAETCLEARRLLESQLAAIRAQELGRVSLGVPTGMPPPLLIPFATYFRREHPELELTITELSSRAGSLAELPDHVDVAMGAFPEGSRLRHMTILESDRFVVAAHRELLRRCLGKAEAEEIEQAAAEGQTVSLTRFQPCPFILKRPGSIVRAREDRIFREAGLTAEGKMETGDLDLSVRLTQLGEAVLYLPEPMARASFDTPGLPERDSPVLLCPVEVKGERWALTAANTIHRPMTPGAETLVACAREYYHRVLG